MRSFLVLAGICACILTGCTTNGSSDGETLAGGEIPAAQAAQIEELGVSINPVASWAVYAPLSDFPPYADVTVTADAPYGNDALQTMDIYTTAQGNGEEPRPVLLFVHGGAFVTGDKRGEYFPQNVTAWAARNGMVGVNMNYRLAPANPWPAGRDDLAHVIRWVQENIASHGGNPDHIILVGHSAGANHVADYISHTQLQGAETQSVVGAILISPAYLPEWTGEANPYYGLDEELQTNASAIVRLGRSPVPVLIAYAQYDPPMFHHFATEAESALCAEGSTAMCPDMVLLEGHNHFTHAASLGTVDGSLSHPLLEWMRGL